MKNRKALIALVGILAMTFFTVGSLSAQTPPATEVEETLDEDLELDNLNPENAADLQIILTTLGQRYEVDVVVLTALIDEGYNVQEIWLALEIKAATGSTLEEALVKADGTDGHGWGVLAKVLGIKPGSDEFMALKGKVVQRNKDKSGDDDPETEGEDVDTEENDRGAGKGKDKD